MRVAALHSDFSNSESESSSSSGWVLESVQSCNKPKSGWKIQYATFIFSRYFMLICSCEYWTTPRFTNVFFAKWKSCAKLFFGRSRCRFYYFSCARGCVCFALRFWSPFFVTAAYTPQKHKIFPKNRRMRLRVLRVVSYMRKMAYAIT